MQAMVDFHAPYRFLKRPPGRFTAVPLKGGQSATPYLRHCTILQHNPVPQIL
jgi:hypothetical protein